MTFNYFEEFSRKVGNTPLIKLKCQETKNLSIYAKCEWHNPTGSIKDRAAIGMIKKYLDETNGKTHILEYSGGNLAKSIGQICYHLGIECTLVLSSGSGNSLLKELDNYGVEIVLVDKSEGFYAVIEKALEISNKKLDYYFLFQHYNHANILSHIEGTGHEIISQMNEKPINAWVASAGTGGTLMGVYKAVKEYTSDVELHLVMPKELPYGSEQPPNGLKKYAGSGGFGLGRKQYFLEKEDYLINKQWNYSYEDTLYEMARFYSETGIKIGTSAAANLLAAKQLGREKGKDFNIVTVFPDAGTIEEWLDVETLLSEK
ncbi:PLP-dependent cysteine synthase family protein [Priestia taiwanensis]|uniref:Cysteine synthase n=1 Tax=Priestia taiwanensis TaxID=1347902 RepID=A0A917EPE8_9BACI|nr:pyridoxal-phosphate dependent enzyme [Priestia taiwanensis]MBM7362443.1 cysteine synthase A [Priestia taiwanensis]GGE62266.1 cysteine synthase [Priestia taiwanensis]